jgi:hypothetical protein
MPHYPGADSVCGTIDANGTELHLDLDCGVHSYQVYSMDWCIKAIIDGWVIALSRSNSCVFHSCTQDVEYATYWHREIQLSKRSRSTYCDLCFEPVPPDAILACHTLGMDLPEPGEAYG